MHRSVQLLALFFALAIIPAVQNGVVLALALTMALLIIEWQQDADRFVGSLPVSRGQAVRARYAWALGVALGATVLYAVYGSMLLALGTERLLLAVHVDPHMHRHTGAVFLWPQGA